MKPPVLVIILMIAFLSCNQKTNNAMKPKKQANDLVNESSPYLLQHAYNPVKWKPWRDETLAMAEQEDKLLVISIGYASCHWCHVMEEESFEDDSIAGIMNANFVNIKVDREERPDIDQIYMDAAQLMTGRGGWPLNIIALPDGRPVYAGTYHPKAHWKQVLNQMAGLYKKEPEKLRKYAKELTQGIAKYNLIEINDDEMSFTKSILDEGIEKQIDLWDSTLGGYRSAPKFPLPNTCEFLMRYAYQSDEVKVLEYVGTTLDKMAFGGIYDQVGGGFSRYSTDRKWHIPHFEKMLYDNAQLVSLYSNAYALTKKEEYKNVVSETLAFVERELRNAEGAFYSSLDADSETENGEIEEGAFYVWTKDELRSVIAEEDFKMFSGYYNINSFGLWENGKYVLIRKNNADAFAMENDLDPNNLKEKIQVWKTALQEARNNKKRPRLDDKSLTSWNGLMLTGYIDAYKVFNDQHYLEVALNNATFISKNQMKGDGGLWHTFKDGRSSVNGYLEDYALVIEAFIDLYTVTADEQWLSKARELAEYTFLHFYNPENTLFYFTSDEDTALISRKTEVLDNVIPSSNSIMAHNLFKLSHYFNDANYKETASQMLNNIKPQMVESPSSFSNWYLLLADMVGPFYEIAVSGDEATEMIADISQRYLPNTMLAGAKKESQVPLMKNRYNEKDTYIYICVDGTCRLPETEIDKALSQIDVQLKD